MANYLQINKCATQDGPGVRVSVYLSGCPLHCEECHNPESWNFDAGELLYGKQIDEIAKLGASEYISGLSILGGEPMAIQNVAATLQLIDQFKLINKNKDIWLWTGYEWDELMLFAEGHEIYEKVLSKIDVIVVGRFKLDERDITKENLWRGSRNQRIIKCKESLHSGEIRLVKTFLIITNIQ